MAADVFGFHAPRLCRIRGEQAMAEAPVPQSAEAFRAGNEAVGAEAETLRDGVPAPLPVVAAAGAAIVLGEPGAGKTSVLRQLTGTLPRLVGEWDRRSDACLWVAGGGLTEGSHQEELGRHLCAIFRRG
ncbi:hypothetical protein J0910_30225 [Nocardiopsis sp. CNT-189]|uniref:hypothetical protein n=1 Tax=Nocardiopsis oceanisediminis TaxID=2816862 RepID=UPI003B2A846E